MAYSLSSAHHSLVCSLLTKTNSVSASSHSVGEDALKLHNIVLNNIRHLMALAVRHFCMCVCQINSLDHKIHFYWEHSLFCLVFIYIMNGGCLSSNVLPVSIEIDILLSAFLCSWGWWVMRIALECKPAFCSWNKSNRTVLYDMLVYAGLDLPMLSFYHENNYDSNCPLPGLILMLFGIQHRQGHVHYFIIISLSQVWVLLFMTGEKWRTS